MAQDCAGNVLFEIFESLGGVASRPQATTARMKHYMQDGATDFGVELPLTKLQYTAFMNEGVPRLRMKAAVTRHLLLVLLRMIEIHFPPRDDHDRRVYLCLRCLCLMYEEFYSWSGKRSRQRARELYRRHFALYMSLARNRLVPGQPWLQWRPKPKHHATHHVFDQTGNPAQFWNYGDESAIGWASNVAETVHVSVLPRALMQKFLVWLDRYSCFVGGE